MKLRASLAALAVLAPLTATAQDEPQVRSYASQVNDVDSVNSHWFETADGVVLIDAQRLLPEAERALEHLRATTDAPVTDILVTHAHTDHYGGLPVWTEAFPEARVHMDAATLASIREDGRGFIAMRGERHGERFASQEALTEVVAGANVVASGDTLTVGGIEMGFEVLGPSEAEATLVVDLPAHGAAFIGDLVNVGAPGVPFEDVDGWLAQLDALEARFDDDDRLHIGHGPSPVDVDAIAEQRRFLEALRDGVEVALDDGAMSEAEVERVVFDLEAGWPFYEGVAGNTCREVLAFAVAQVAEQLGGQVEG